MKTANAVAAVGAALTVGTAVVGAVVESVPLLAVAAGVGIASTVVKLSERRRDQEEHRRDTTPMRAVG